MNTTLLESLNHVAFATDSELSPVDIDRIQEQVLYTVELLTSYQMYTHTDFIRMANFLLIDLKLKSSQKIAACYTGNHRSIAVSRGSSVIVAAASRCEAKAGVGGYIILTRWSDIMKRYHARVAHVGENGIKPDTWYTLDENCKFVKA